MIEIIKHSILAKVQKDQRYSYVHSYAFVQMNIKLMFLFNKGNLLGSYDNDVTQPTSKRSKVRRLCMVMHYVHAWLCININNITLTVTQN